MAKKADIEQTEIEAPYELPEGWKWCRLGDVCEKIKRGKSPKYTDKSKILVFAQKCNQPDGTMSLEKALFLNEELLSKYKDDDFVKDGDILINSTGTGTIGRVGYFDKALLPEGMKLVPDTHVTTVRACADNASKFFYYFIKQKESYLELKGVGTTNMKELHADVLENLSFPLPPTLAEQQRIVNRIETMFAKLDEAKEKAQSVVDSFETRKAAILHKAFSGKWKVESGKWKAENWEEKKLGDIVNGFKYGVSDKCDYKNDGIPVLRIPNVGDGIIDFSDLKYSERNDIEENYIVKENDILIIRSNGSRELVGKSALYTNTDKQFSYGSFLIKITPSEVVNPKYLVTFLNSDDARNQMFNKAKSSSGIHNINTKELSEIRLKLPPLNYQLSIVNFLDTVLEKESRAKEAAQTVLDQIALLKKSILARAFRGEL
ncbi:MAG: restriction endonuclease subunit S [Treponema sp.]|nr:restriction endonuclease subunit S [Treponema sp.]